MMFSIVFNCFIGLLQRRLHGDSNRRYGTCGVGLWAAWTDSHRRCSTGGKRCALDQRLTGKHSDHCGGAAQPARTLLAPCDVLSDSATLKDALRAILVGLLETESTSGWEAVLF